MGRRTALAIVRRTNRDLASVSDEYLWRVLSSRARFRCRMIRSALWFQFGPAWPCGPFNDGKEALSLWHGVQLIGGWPMR